MPSQKKVRCGAATQIVLLFRVLISTNSVDLTHQNDSDEKKDDDLLDDSSAEEHEVQEEDSQEMNDILSRFFLIRDGNH